MRTKTFTENGITITVRAETISDALDIDLLMHLMGHGTTSRERYKRGHFMRCIQLSTVEGDLGFVWPDPEAAGEAELLDAYEGWKALPGDLARRWLLELHTVSASPNAPELTPDVKKNTEATPT